MVALFLTAAPRPCSAAFGTGVPKDAAKKILDDGDVEMTAAERKEAVEKKRAEIVNCSIFFLFRVVLDGF